MKKFNIARILAIFSTLFLFSCEEDLVTYEESDFVIFGETSASIAEDSDDPLQISVQRSRADQAITVELSAVSYYADDPDVEASSTFSISQTSLQFAEGEFETTVTVDPVDNNTSDGAKIVSLSIASVSDEAFSTGFPGESAFNGTVTITIEDEDCPVNSEAVTGTFEVNEVFTEGPNEGLSLAAAFEEVYLLEITADPDDPSGTMFIINNAEGANQFFEPDTPISLNTCPKTVNFRAGDPIVALFADMAVDATSYDDASGLLTFSGELGNYGLYEVVLEKM